MKNGFLGTKVGCSLGHIHDLTWLVEATHGRFYPSYYHIAVVYKSVPGCPKRNLKSLPPETAMADTPIKVESDSEDSNPSQQPLAQVTSDNEVPPAKDEPKDKKTKETVGVKDQNLAHIDEKDKNCGTEVKIMNAIEKGLGKTKENKRKLEETPDNKGEKRGTKKPRPNPKTSNLKVPSRPISYLPRKRFHEELNQGDNETVEKAFFSLRELPFRNLAIALNDCRPQEREKRVREMTKDEVKKLGNYIYQMYEHPKLYDPYSNFPTLIHSEIVNDMIAKKNLLSPNCYICSMKFEDFQRYEWKNCKGHIMHYRCLVESIEQGEEVLAGACDCPIKLSR